MDDRSARGPDAAFDIDRIHLARVLGDERRHFIEGEPLDALRQGRRGARIRPPQKRDRHAASDHSFPEPLFDKMNVAIDGIRMPEYIWRLHRDRRPIVRARQVLQPERLSTKR